MCHITSIEGKSQGQVEFQPCRGGNPSLTKAWIFLLSLYTIPLDVRKGKNGKREKED